MNKDISRNNNKNRRENNNRNNIYKKNGNNNRIHNNNTNNSIKRTMTSGLTVVGKWGRHMDGPITCSSLALQGDEKQREHGKLIQH
jgi:hypothetical protein